jgi:hypothetical protein
MKIPVYYCRDSQGRPHVTDCVDALPPDAVEYHELSLRWPAQRKALIRAAAEIGAQVQVRDLEILPDA